MAARTKWAPTVPRSLTRAVNRSYYAEVLAADPNFSADKNRVLEYDFSEVGGVDRYAYYQRRGAYDGSYGE